MKFTFDWLKDHLRTDLNHLEIAEKMTALGIEVEEIFDNNKKFENFVVGYIKSALRHPNADKLQVCEVDIGSEVLQIVCGAKNAREGLYVAVAKVGALVPAFGEKLKKGVIRGIESQGMMCSTDELLIEDDGIDGILELPHNLTPGQSLVSALDLDNIIFDVSLTPNRADCFSVRGIARDLAASGAGELLNLEDFKVFETFENVTDVEILTGNCEFFSTLAVQNVLGRTPIYIERRLKAVGQKLIHFPVDIANYVCLDIGQPLHIFDFDKLPKKLVVRDSVRGERLKTLDGNETVLPDGSVVVASKSEVLSIAGIMGGESTSFSENSKNILIESAYFEKSAIALAGQRLKVSTDSRTRGERGIDPANVEYALRYVAHLLSQSCECKVSNARTFGTLPSNQFEVTLHFENFKNMTNHGVVEWGAARGILESLGCRIIEANDEYMKVRTPSWRHDLKIEEDLIEEILRLMGYSNIKEVELEKKDPVVKNYTTDKLTDSMIYSGYSEVRTFSFIDRKTSKLFAGDDELIELDDASSEFSILRPTIIASHLKSVKSSQNKSQKNSKFFEIGKRFRIANSKINEEKVLCITLSEKMSDRAWREQQRDVSIFDVKEIIERLLGMLGISSRLVSDGPGYFHPGRKGTYIFRKDTVVAQFGEIHPTIVSQLDLKGPIVSCEIFLNNLPIEIEQNSRQPLVLSPYQPTSRDFSFVVERSVTCSSIIAAITKLKIPEISNVSVFDIYESDILGSGKKAVGIEVAIQPQKDTLTDERLCEISDQIINNVSKNCKAILR